MCHHGCQELPDRTPLPILGQWIPHDDGRPVSEVPVGEATLRRRMQPEAVLLGTGCHSLRPTGLAAQVHSLHRQRLAKGTGRSGKRMSSDKRPVLIMKSKSHIMECSCYCVLTALLTLTIQAATELSSQDIRRRQRSRQLSPENT